MDKQNRLVLAGDIGGTKTNLGLYRIDGNRPELDRAEKFSSQQASSLSEMIEKFLTASERAHVIAACFGVAGPIIEGHSKLTNLTWDVSETEIRGNFGFKKVTLINDLTAIGYGVQILRDDEILILNEGKSNTNGVAGLIAPGTGLGISILTPIGGKLKPWPSEGGHADLAPRNDREWALFKYAVKEKGHVSLERLISGPGIHIIYSWLVSLGEFEVPEWVTERMKLKNPTAVISEAAIQNGVPICVETLNIFVSLLGAAAGNLALTLLATGGLYVGGGVPPKILPKLKESTFMEAFFDKHHFRKLLETMPVKVILNDKLGMVGAALCAAESCETDC